MIEENPYLSKEDCTNLVSSPGYREEINCGGIELAVGKLQMGSSHPHHQSKLEKTKILRNLFGQYNKLQVNYNARANTGMKIGLTLKIRDPQYG
jgi:hypothetical protein